MIVTQIRAALIFFAPAGVANATPIIANKIPFLNRWKAPIDCGLTWRGKRILGNNKTWRGLVSGMVSGGLVGFLEYWFIFKGSSLSVSLIILNVSLGMLLGFGALIGDAIESLFKRRINIASGKSWFPFDQIDYIVGGLLLSLPIVRLPLDDYLWTFLVWFLLHIIISYVGYLLHLKDQPI